MTYSEHYKKCREITTVRAREDSKYSSVYDLTVDTDFIDKGEDYLGLIRRLSKKVSNKIDDDVGCWHGSNFVTYLNEWRDIEEVTELANLIMPQIEQNVFHCDAQIEFVLPYRNNFYEGELQASWLWHYDDCPREFIKFAVYLNETTHDSGCFQYFADADSKPIVLPTFREAPNRPVTRQYFAGSRIPLSAIKSVEAQGGGPRSVIGPLGTHILFTPTAIHRATAPKPNTMPREAIFFFIRPALKQRSSYINDGVRSILPKRNVKQYELD